MRRPKEPKEDARRDLPSKAPVYEAPRVLHCEKIESLAVVCNSARAPSGSCRVASVATCITLYG